MTLDLESLRDLLWEIDNQVVTHGIGYREVITRTERVVSEVIAELAARRARDAEVEALVKAVKDAARDIHLVLSIDGQELELGSLRKLSSAERNLRTTLSAFTGAKP